MAGEGDQVEEDGEVRLRQKGAERAFGLARTERIPLHGWVAARREGGEGDPLAGEDRRMASAISLWHSSRYKTLI